MSAKSLEEWLPLKAEPLRPSVFGSLGMAERHRRSVHREVCRPQGVRSPQRQFSPVKSVDAGDDGFNVLRSQHGCRRHGEAAPGPSGFEAVACMQRSDLELGRARRFPQGYACPTNRRAGR